MNRAFSHISKEALVNKANAYTSTYEFPYELLWLWVQFKSTQQKHSNCSELETIYVINVEAGSFSKSLDTHNQIHMHTLCLALNGHKQTHTCSKLSMHACAHMSFANESTL